MSWVLLFVQTGDGRPKCAGRPASGGSLVSMGYASRRTYTKAIEGWWLSPGKQNATKHADRWWLVECENADAGRACIAAHNNPGSGKLRDVLIQAKGYLSGGRILATGGRAAQEGTR